MSSTLPSSVTNTDVIRRTSPSASTLVAADACSPYPGEGTQSSPYLVDFLVDDPENPYNFSNAYRWWLTTLIGITTLCPPFASVSYSAAMKEVQVAYGIGNETAIAGISVFIAGYGLGPLIWAPTSEIWGRYVAFAASYPLFTIFNLGTALSHNLNALLATRFFAGFCGGITLTNSGGQIGDMWAAHERQLATSIFSIAPFLGPVLGPIVGGYVTEFCGYRWVFWLQFIYAAVTAVACLIFIPETYAPTLLRRRAARLQKEAAAAGRDEVYIAKYDKVKKTPKKIVMIGLYRPFELLFTESIVWWFSLYGALVYGTLYLFFTAFPIVFQEVRGWSVGKGGLSFLGMGFGLILGIAFAPVANIWYRRASRGGKTPPPESRLPLCCIGAVLLPLGLFWFAWTSAPPVHWIWPILACIPFGFAFLVIFNGMVIYVIDSYTLYAASALAAQAISRCILGAIFPLFASQLYKTLGLHWAGTLIAFLSLAFTPLPFLFYIYGARLRRRSRYAPSTPLTKEEEANETAREKAEELKKIRTREESGEALEPEWATDAGEHAHSSFVKPNGSRMVDLEKAVGTKVGN